MRHADLTKLAAAALIGISSVGAFALTPAGSPGALPPLSTASAPAGAPTPEPSKSLTSAAVAAVPMGNIAAIPTSGTLHELEDLQRQTALLEMKKKLAEMKGGAAPSESIQGSGGDKSIDPYSEQARARRKARFAAAAAASVEPAAPAVTAKVVQLIVIAGRARADIVENARIRTVQEGDDIDGWNVESITSKGVKVAHRKSVHMAPPTLPAQSTSASSSRAALMAQALVMADRLQSPSTQERVTYAMLEPATSTDLPMLGNAAPAQAQVSAAPAATAPVVPPLPAAVSTDSTSMRPAQALQPAGSPNSAGPVVMPNAVPEAH